VENITSVLVDLGDALFTSLMITYRAKILLHAQEVFIIRAT